MARKPAPSSPDATSPPVASPMFSNLVASKPGREDRSGVLASAISLLVHGAVAGFLVWATMTAGQAELPPPEVGPVVLHIPVPLPPAPVAAAPTVDVPAPTIATDVPIGTPELSVPTIIPPDIPAPLPGTAWDARDVIGDGPVGRPDGNPDRTVTSDDIAAGPIFVPMTVRPAIRNTDEVARALQRFYPPLLRDAGIGGTVVVWILIDEEGRVVRTQVHASSGNPALDDAALRIGEVVRFTPAMNRDRRVPVWIQWPIDFRSR